MYCKHCGERIPEGNRFCIKCGTEYQSSNSSDVAPLLRRAKLFLEEENWGKADDYCEQVLDKDPENVQAYLIKLLIRAQVKTEAELAEAQSSFADWSSYRNVHRFADDALRGRLEGYLKTVEEAIALRKQEEQAQQEITARQEIERQQSSAYYQACKYQKNTSSVRDLSEAIKLFTQIFGYEDSEERLQDCKQLLAKRKNEIAQEEYDRTLREQKEKRKKIIIIGSILSVVIAVIIVIICTINASNSQRAGRIEAQLTGMRFKGTKIEFGDVISGHIAAAQTRTDYESTYTFMGDGTITVDTIERFDRAPFTLLNGALQWDRVDQYSDTDYGGDVHISLFGDVTVTINGRSYELLLNGDTPTGFVMDGVTYSSE